MAIRPIQSLNKGLMKVAKGDLNENIKIQNLELEVRQKERIRNDKISKIETKQ